MKLTSGRRLEAARLQLMPGVGRAVREGEQMTPLLEPGPRRRTFVALLLVFTASAALALGVTAESGNAMSRATAILIISIVGFHSMAVVTFDCTKAWRCISYPSLLTSFMAVVTTLATLHETGRLTRAASAIQSRQAAYQDLIYALRSTITNDCHPKPSRAQMWTPSPEPYEGACDRMEHFLPQIEDAAVREQRIEGLNSGMGWGQNVTMANTTPVGSWAGLYSAAKRFTKSSDAAQEALDALKANPPSRVAAWAGSAAVKYWYFLLAFFLGANLSKVTTDYLVGAQAANATAALPINHAALSSDDKQLPANPPSTPATASTLAETAPLIGDGSRSEAAPQQGDAADEGATPKRPPPLS
jgi:hypothetical protein